MVSTVAEVVADRSQEIALGAAEQIRQLVIRARAAQADFEAFSQEQVDAIVRDLAKHVYDNARTLARRAVDETELGNYDDKVAKCLGKSRVIWNSLKGKKSRGIIGEDSETGLILVAKPVGVVGAICPVTNPVVTPMCNAMFALKTGNAIIFAPHPKAGKLTEDLTEAFRKILRKHSAPEHLIQTVTNGSLDHTQALMKAVDVVVATGGGAMVKSAYSSGRPSFGVGPGNVPVILDRGIDLVDACNKVVAGASFDNGIICSHEQFVLVPNEDYQRTIDQFLSTGKVWFTADPAQVQKLRALVFPDGHMNKDVVGQSPQAIGRMVGLEIPEGVRIILLPAEGAGSADLLAREKLCPVVAILPYGKFEEAIRLARSNLMIEGAGHTAAIHSSNEGHIRAMGLALPISRLVVNQISATSAGGSLTNGFAATTTLGCGSWGGNSISENLDYKHLMNVSRIGKVITGKAVPTDEEIWAA